MAVCEIKKRGNNPLWTFKCPLCGEEWTEFYLSGSDLTVCECDTSGTIKLGEKTFRACIICHTCGLPVWSEPITKKVGVLND